MQLEVLHCTLEENPLHSNLVERTYMAFLYFICLCNRGMGRMVLMKDVNHSHSILLTVSMHISWPCTFWVYFTSFCCFTFYSRLLVLQELQQLYFNSGCQRCCVWMRCDTSWLVFHLSVDSLLLFGGQVICLRIKKIHPNLFCWLLSSDKQKMKISTLCWALQTWVYILLLFYLSSHY